MILNLRHRWHETRSSFWFVPAVIVLSAVGLAAGLIGIDANVELGVEKMWPLVFAGGAAGSRGLLSVVASSMITVAGVVFSITIVALSLTSSQYTSRVLRNFMRDRTNQVVLGVFVGIFAYCLVVLRTIRSGDDGMFVPSLAVLGGLVFAFVGIGYLIFYIHHISVSIQASSIIAAAARETIAAVDRLFPKGLGEDPEKDNDDNFALSHAKHNWTAVPSRTTGYIESIDGDALLALARKHGIVLRMERGIGEFIVEGAPLLSATSLQEMDEQTASQLNAIYIISHQRTVEQDAAFGIRQIVDIALKALSPGINDTTTASICVDYLGAILVHLAVRRIAPSHRMDRGVVRLIARGPSFGSLLAEAFDQIRQNAKGNVAVLERLLQALENMANLTTGPRRMQEIKQQAKLIGELAECTIACQHDRTCIEAALLRISQLKLAT